ncbi:MAG: glycosyltransferase family 39 protein [Planctomycetota bacterium]
MSRPPAGEYAGETTSAPLRGAVDGALPRPARPRWWCALLLAATAFTCFWGLRGGAGFEMIDCWVAQTAREMREAGDWLVPRFSGETRMQKSPGPYWAVMLVSAVRGGPVDEFSARLPSAVAGFVLVATIYWLTRRIAGDRAALFAGFAASASVLVLWWSHRAASDLGLTACTTLALAAIWIAAESEPGGRRRGGLWLLGYFAAGVGMLYKMPMPLVVVGPPAVVYLLLKRRWAVLRSTWHLAGLAAFLLPWLPWAVAVALTEDRALLKWKVEFFDRFTGALPNVAGQSEGKFLLTYLGPMLFYTLPFTLSLPGAFYRAVRPPAGVRRDGVHFCLIWFLSLLAFFTASAGKEWRYFLPALPPLFVLLGIELSLFFAPDRPRTPRRDRFGAAAVWVLAPALLLGGGLHGLRRYYDQRLAAELAGIADWPAVRNAYLVAALLLVAGCGLAALLYARRREHASFATVVVMMYAAWLWLWPMLMPLLASQRSYREFATELAALPAELRPALRFVGSPEPRITWYGDVRMPRVLDQLALLDEQGGRRDLKYETRRTGERMIDLLDAPEPVLFVAGCPEFLTFVVEAPRALADASRPVPPMYLWLQNRYGRVDRHQFLFGNRAPPGGEPPLNIPDDLRAQLAEKGHTLPVRLSDLASGTQPAALSRPAADGASP